ncbi:hypothetical protein ACI5KX_04160 [Erythrobacter sp. GH1-10]|uniref:hypothetical protein n=1 Tax=Erythrobacter sp. GH1-10 TaxID=3349334 RepID=UPI003878302D
MLEKIFPKQFDNQYRGHWVALVLLWIITAFKTLMAYNTAINSRYGAVNADGIPIDSYSPEAGIMVLNIFAKLGNMHFIIVALSLLALIRYRAMVPLIYLILVYEYLTRRLITMVWLDVPYMRIADDTAGLIVQSLFLAMVIGFGLSIWSRGSDAGRVETAEG